MSALADLRADYDDLTARSKNGEPWLRLRAGDAYNRWFHQACLEGRPPDSLERSSPVESERFFARVISGVDGHCYWDSRQGFRRNDGQRRNARKWWWEHRHGPITDRSVVKPTCGEPNCITVDHQRLVPWGELKQRYTDEQCIGALQVAALRLGHSPSMHKYDTLGLRPSSALLQIRFTSWSRALRAAGLPEAPPGSQYVEVWSETDCLDALRSIRDQLGFVPSGRWWTRTRQQPSRRTIQRRLGGWSNALRKAGLIA